MTDNTGLSVKIKRDITKTSVRNGDENFMGNPYYLRNWIKQLRSCLQVYKYHKYFIVTL